MEWHQKKGEASMTRMTSAQWGMMVFEVASNLRDPSTGQFEELRLVGGKALSARLKEAVKVFWVSSSGAGQGGY